MFVFNSPHKTVPGVSGLLVLDPQNDTTSNTQVLPITVKYLHRICPHPPIAIIFRTMQMLSVHSCYTILLENNGQKCLHLIQTQFSTQAWLNV